MNEILKSIFIGNVDGIIDFINLKSNIDYKYVTTSYDLYNIDKRNNRKTIFDMLFKNFIPELTNKEKFIEAIVWLKSWLQKTSDKKIYTHLPIGIDEYFIKEKKSYELYRGLVWYDKEQLLLLDENLDFAKYNVGSTINLSLKYLTSWSKNIKVANGFAYGKYGVVLKVFADPQNILVDIDLTLPNFLEQEEVILLPGKYKCIIISIVSTDKELNNKDLSFGLDKIISID